jgi:hypothetical protein
MDQLTPAAAGNRTFRLGLLPRILALFLPVALILAAAFPARAEAQGRGVSGRWKVLVKVGEESRDYFLELKQDGDKITGDLISPRSGKYPIAEGTFKDGKLRLKVPRNERTFVVEAELKGEKIEGKLLVDGNEEGSVEVTREAPPLAGKWNVVTKAGDRDYQSTMTLSEEGGALKGKAESQLGVFDMRNLAYREGRFSFELSLPIQGNDVAFAINAELVDANTLRGQWKARDAEFSGEWSAVREVPPEAKKAEAPAGAAPAKELLGDWFGVAPLPDGKKVTFHLHLASQEGKHAGKVAAGDHNLDLANVKFDGARFEASHVSADGQGQVKLVGELKGDVLEGRWSSADGQAGEFKARKPKKL